MQRYPYALWHINRDCIGHTKNSKSMKTKVQRMHYILTVSHKNTLTKRGRTIYMRCHYDYQTYSFSISICVNPPS